MQPKRHSRAKKCSLSGLTMAKCVMPILFQIESNRKNSCEAHTCPLSSNSPASPDMPSFRSCRKLSEYSNVPLDKILSLVGYLPKVAEKEPAEWPEFREYALRKYPTELDEDLITMIEDLIERRRGRRSGI